MRIDIVSHQYVAGEQCAARAGDLVAGHRLRHSLADDLGLGDSAAVRIPAHRALEFRRKVDSGLLHIRMVPPLAARPWLVQAAEDFATARRLGR